VEQQQAITQELQRQNAALLVLTANIDKEVKSIRQETAALREVNERVRLQPSGGGTGQQSSKKLPP